MARYDDGGIEFGQEQFAKARSYNEEQAKKQERFSKRLQLANIAVTGVTSLINQKADALEASNATQRAHYLTQLENAKGWQAMVKGYNDKGIYNRGEMLYEETFRNLRDKVQNEFGQDYDISIYDDTIKDMARNYATDKNNLKSWNKTVDAQLAIPSLSQEDMITRIQQEGAQPRSIGAWFGKKLTKLAKSHDEETMSAADKEAKSRMLGGLLGEQFKSAKDAITEYGQTSGKPIAALVEFMKTDKGKEFASKVTKDKKFIVKERITEDGFGNIVKVQSTSVAGIGRGDTGAVELGETIDVAVLEKTAPEKVPSANEALLIGSQISGFIEEANDPDLDSQYARYLKKGNDAGLVLNVNKTATILTNTYGISKSMAIGMATRHILNQPSPFKETNISSYQVDKLKEVAADFKIKFVDTEKVNDYIKSILKSNPDNAAIELAKMYNEFGNSIREADTMDDDTKLQELISLNNLLRQYIPDNIKSPESFLVVPKSKPKQDLFEGSLPEGTVLGKDDEIVVSPLILSP